MRIADIIAKTPGVTTNPRDKRMSINPDLPEICYAIEEDSGKIIAILRGDSGYSIPPNLPAHLEQNAEARRAWVDGRNLAMGVTPAQRDAMIAASMFGWNSPLANPEKFPTASEYRNASRSKLSP